jgi:hypothetical protein
MKVRLLVGLALGVSVLLGSGCYSTQEGSVRVGVPFAKDTIVSRYELPYARVYEAAKETLKRHGQLTNDDSVTKVLKGVVNNRIIWIRIDDTDRRITQIEIQARTKAGATDVDLASELDKQVYGQLILQQ